MVTVQNIHLGSGYMNSIMNAHVLKAKMDNFEIVVITDTSNALYQYFQEICSICLEKWNKRRFFNFLFTHEGKDFLSYRSLKLRKGVLNEIDFYL